MKQGRRSRDRPSGETVPGAAEPTSGRRFHRRGITGVGFAAMLAVWATYHPADSVAVQSGGALPWTMATTAVAAVLFAVLGWHSKVTETAGPVRGSGKVGGASWQFSLDHIDWLLLLLAGLIVVAAWWPTDADCLGGDRRAAQYVGWLGLAGCGWTMAVRRWAASRQAAGTALVLIVGCGVLLAVHGLHQQWVSLPQTLQDYLTDPEGTLRKIGVEAPAGSAARMIYENRLRDGGPTATFALTNSLAGALAMVTGVTIGWLVCRSVGPPASRLSRGQLLAASCVLLPLLLAVWATHSRGAVLALVVVGSLTIVIGFGRRVTPLLKTIPSIAVGAAAVLALVALPLVAAMSMTLDAVPGDANDLTEFSPAGPLTTGTEWFDQAPASIQYRLQYWRATLAMAADRPWLGARPGNFQLVYQAYRDADAHETVAEPHHFWFETLAAAGWLAGITLACLLVAVVAWGWRSIVQPSDPPAESDLSPDANLYSGDEAEQSGERQPWYVTAVFGAAGVGAAVGWLGVWTVALRSGNVPDVEAHLIGVPLGIAAAVVVASGLKKSSMREVQTVAAAGLATGMLHLSFSGGWLVPGVAWIVWTLVGILTAKSFRHSVVPDSVVSGEGGPNPGVSGEVGSSPSQGRRRVGAVHVWSALSVCCVAAVLAAYFVSYRPAVSSRSALESAAAASQRGLTGQASQFVQRALQQDPLAADPAVWRLQWLWSRQLQTLLRQPGATGEIDLTTADPLWDDAVADARRRIGNDPTRMRVVADLFVHRYQVTGRPSDLREAWDWIAAALLRSPTHEALMAQAADIRREAVERQVDLPQEFSAGRSGEGTKTDFAGCGHAVALPDPTSPEALATRASRLGEAGGVLTRQLSRRFVLPARHIGAAAVPQPVRTAAAEVLQWAR